MIQFKRNVFFWMFCFLLFAVSGFSSTPEKETRQFVERDGLSLKMDLYRSEVVDGTRRPCILFVFGGGFKNGTRDAELYQAYFRSMAEKGYLVASIDYRLGLKDKKGPTLFNRKPLEEAIEVAVEDLYEATAYLLRHAEALAIDTGLMMISGSSSGGITVLQADYLKRNKQPSVLPDAFQYAGVIAFAGAIYSVKGTPAYAIPPSPTLFFHGSADKLVPYGSKRLFNAGLFGSKSLVKRFKKSGYPFCFYSMTDMGHAVADYPLEEFLDEIHLFVQRYVIEKQAWMEEVQLKDLKREVGKNLSPSEYYK